MSRHFEVSICDNCKRGMIIDRIRNKARCYVCLRETEGHGSFVDFDPTGEFLQFVESDIRDAIIRECIGNFQKDVAERMNITPQYLTDILRGRRPISPVVSAYYWLDRRTIFVPRFTQETP